jgi:acetyltransferase-like isoleucine patch superfamily enzyme
MPREKFIMGLKNRILQTLAQSAPGGFTTRVWFHRWRGVRIGEGVHIGPGVVIETAFPQWISIGNNVQIGTHCLILAHVHSLPPRKSELADYISVVLEDDVYVGAGSLILPNVRIGRGAVVAAGSVVSRAVPPMTMVQGNPAKPMARCGIPLTWDTPLKTFYSQLRSLERSNEPSVITLERSLQAT